MNSPSSDTIQLPIKRLHEDVILPRYAYSGDAGLDLCSYIDLVLKPFERFLVPTGLAIAIPDGYAGFVPPFVMSSHTACLTILLKHRYYTRTDTEKWGSNHLIENSSEQTQMLL